MLPAQMPYLTAGSVVLRAFEARDVDVVRAAGRDPLIPPITTVPVNATVEDARAYISRQHDRLVAGTGYSFAVADAGTGDGVGQIGLWLSHIDQGRASVGYWIAPQFRERGYATDALAALTVWAIAIEEIARIELYVEPWNVASWRVAETCGYQREGLMRSWQEVGGVRKDMLMYSTVSQRHRVPRITTCAQRLVALDGSDPEASVAPRLAHADAASAELPEDLVIRLRMDDEIDVDFGR